MNNKIQLDIITSIKFPLIVGVILIHSILSDIMFSGNLIEVDSYKVYNVISYIFSDLLGKLCVPLFFFISGFLFFYKVEDFSITIYKEKLAKRAKSLLVPYILWTLITLLIYFVAEIIVPELFSGRNKLISDYSLIDFISCFWDAPSQADTLPLYSPFWYIRDLLVVVLLSPLIYIFLKSKARFLYITLIVLAYAFELWPIKVPGFAVTSFCFFSLGAFFSVNKRNFVDFAHKILWVLLPVYLVTLCLEQLCGDTVKVYMHHINCLAGIGLMINLFATLLNKGCIKPNKFLSNSCFFLFAYHMIPLTLLKKVLFLIIPEITNITLVAVYFICPLVIVLLGLLFYYMLNKYLPTITNILTGSR